jgi:exosortase J
MREAWKGTMSTNLENPLAAQHALSQSETTAAEPHTDRFSTTSPLLWSCIGLLTALGCLGLSREIHYLWIIWTMDPLRSIGMLIPPASLLLTLRVWRQNGWAMRGTWWGLPLLASSFAVSVLRSSIVIQGLAGNGGFNPIPAAIPIFLYGCGTLLLLAGPQTVRKAWFPLGLLLLCQPVPSVFNLLDFPLQHAAANTARSFATLIGFAPSTPQLRLMFSPRFGMFIAPGCDGIRGAVTLGYVALLLGYIKRVSLLRWMAYVAGAVLLGYLFNFTRLCVLVLYYRMALGHPALEGAAKWADYCIGSSLFLFATLLALRLLRDLKGSSTSEADSANAASSARPMARMQSPVLKCAAFAVVVGLALALPGSALRDHAQHLTLQVSYADRMPKTIGNYALTRTWYEQVDGITVVQAGAYSLRGGDEIILAIWVSPNGNVHNANDCLITRGLQPTSLSSHPFTVAQGKTVDFRTGFYNDGITDTVVANAVCALSSCVQFTPGILGSKFDFGYMAFEQQKVHPVSFMVRIDRLASEAPESNVHTLLTTELQQFLVGLDASQLSQSFQ